MPPKDSNISKLDKFLNTLRPADSTGPEQVQITARYFLTSAFKEFESIRSIIQKFEEIIVTNIKSGRNDWRIEYIYLTKSHRFVLQKLCEYYTCGYEYDQSTTVVTFFYSPLQKLQQPISDVSQPISDGIDQEVSKSIKEEPLVHPPTIFEPLLVSNENIMTEDLDDLAPGLSEYESYRPNVSMEQIQPSESRIV
ncbi:hypothetical protein RF11_10751 [Thelohanellus kitauei]|uniref:Uncharacterized protein n=1 Tax=Thelohanellus kitauei TaxID=669202 RepID=A0A0C2MKY5_THEKT|nr:hypothetical protein RF11_10751 [Thelohanellus kitauei]